MELQVIQSKIHEIRGYKVIIDKDLAVMYGVETRRLNEQVKRNYKRFEGDDFMFQLSQKEVDELSRSQFAILKGKGSNIKYAPYAFTELGVAMLSSVLNSDIAIEANRGIMRAFIAIRQILTQPQPDRYEELKQYIEEMFTDQNDINEDTRMQLEIISQSLAEMQVKSQPDKPRLPIGYIKFDKE